MRPRAVAILCAAAGLAVSSAANAQYGLVSNIPGSFTDISATGTALPGGDDVSTAFGTSVVNPPVTFAALYASTNGVVSSSQFSAFANTPFPLSGAGLALAPLWDDLFVDAPGSLRHQGLVENGISVEVIEWAQVRTYAGGASGPRGSFEIKIFAPGGPAPVQFIYQDPSFAGGGASATIGIQLASGAFSQYSFNTASVSAGTVLSLVPMPSGACCLPNSSVTCGVTDAASCAALGGSYHGDGTSCATAGCPSGACCLPNGSCTTAAGASCASQNGVYRGDGSSCATANCPSGACCLTNPACVIASPAGCTAQGGIYRGDGVACAAANCPGLSAGPDVYVQDLIDAVNYGAVGPITAYAIGTNACNLGDAPVNWYGSTNQHPVITSNMFRLMNGRFEQIGQAWAKHGFGSSNTNCPQCVIPPGGGQQLGVGCADAYGATTNGGQSFLGPRSQVNATTGVFPYPVTGVPPATTLIDHRLQVFTTDVTPAMNPGALYFAEGHYVTADDAGFNNGLNNATYRQVSIASPTAAPTFAAAAHIRSPAIQAWHDQDPSVILVPADFSDPGVTARFWVAAKATDNGNGTWHYEYAIYNHNADRAAASFSVPLPMSAQVTSTGFHAPFSHSGEPFDNSPWTPSAAAGTLTFSTTPYSVNPNANALRWGTLYNVRFDATTAPIVGAATLGLFKPGTPASLVINGLPIPGPGVCYANCDNSTVSPILNVNDFVCFQNRFAAGDSYANCDSSTAPPVLNVNDFVCFVNRFAGGCP